MNKGLKGWTDTWTDRWTDSEKRGYLSSKTGIKYDNTALRRLRGAISVTGMDRCGRKRRYPDSIRTVNVTADMIAY